MSDWKFDYHEVLKDADNRWWHVIGRWNDVDRKGRKYELSDATHTEYKTLRAGDLEGLPSESGMMDSTGWKTDTKPAAENGFRVNGVLCGPQGINHWKGNECVHEYTCHECGRSGMADIDVIRCFEDRELAKTMLECRVCGHCWEETNG